MDREGQGGHSPWGRPLHAKESILAQLATMRASGEISPEEFAAARAKVIGHAEGVNDNSDALKETGPDPAVVLPIAFVLLLIGFISLVWFVAPSPEERAASELAGSHCLSSLDGSHRELVDAVRSGLRDPNSFEHVETLIAPVVNGQHVIAMTYRARNGFGGVNVEEVVGTVSHSTCDLLDWRFQ